MIVIFALGHFFIAMYTISIVHVTLFTQFYKSQENDILSSDRLERYIANIASLDWWLATIGNNHIWWSMNLKNIGPSGLAKNCSAGNNKPKKMKNHEKQSKYFDQPWKPTRNHEQP